VRKRNRSAAELGVLRKAWTVAEFAASLGIDYDAALDLIHEGKVRVFKVGNQYRISDAAMQEYIAEAEQEQAAS
jgi:excisionase family DNA binding protein